MKTEFEVEVKRGKTIWLSEEELVSLLARVVKRALLEDEVIMKSIEEMKKEVELKQLIRSAVREGFAEAISSIKQGPAVKSKSLKEHVIPRKTKVKKDYKIEKLDFKLDNHDAGDNLTKEGVISLFNEISAHKSNSGYYVGITCDPDRRAREHKAEFLAVVECPSVEKANELEKLLEKEDFETGGATGNGHKPSTTKVYIYRISRKTKE